MDAASVRRHAVDSYARLREARPGGRDLREQDVDLWITLVRETMLTSDPCLDLIAGTYSAWTGAFLVSATGERVAIVARFDVPSVAHIGAYDVIGYDEGVRPALRDTVERLAPRSIALNYSESDPAAVGIIAGSVLLHELGHVWAARNHSRLTGRTGEVDSRTMHSGSVPSNDQQRRPIRYQSLGHSAEIECVLDEPVGTRRRRIAFYSNVTLLGWHAPQVVSVHDS